MAKTKTVNNSGSSAYYNRLAGICTADLNNPGRCSRRKLPELSESSHMTIRMAVTMLFATALVFFAPARAGRAAPATSKPATQSATAPSADAKPVVAEPTLPKVPNGFLVNVYTRAPEIYSPVSLAVSADGEKLLVAEDEYK